MRLMAFKVVNSLLAMISVTKRPASRSLRKLLTPIDPSGNAIRAAKSMRIGASLSKSQKELAALLAGFDMTSPTSAQRIPRLARAESDALKNCFGTGAIG